MVCETAEAAASPTKDIVEDVVETIRNGLDTFLEECPVLMKALDELAKIHPAIGGRRTTSTRYKPSLNTIYYPSGRSRLQSCVWHVEDQQRQR